MCIQTHICILKVAILWDMAPWNEYVNRRSRGSCHLHLQGRKSADKETRVQQVARQIFILEYYMSVTCLKREFGVLFNIDRMRLDRLCGLVVTVPGDRTEMYCASCDVRIQFIYAL
jgi:hypothetical protein